MHPTYRRFRDPGGSDLGPDHEDARDLARSLQPPSVRTLSAAALRELEARVGPQYVPTASQLQLFQQQQQQQQQQRRGGDPFFPRASSDSEWPPGALDEERDERDTRVCRVDDRRVWLCVWKQHPHQSS